MTDLNTLNVTDYPNITNNTPALAAALHGLNMYLTAQQSMVHHAPEIAELYLEANTYEAYKSLNDKLNQAAKAMLAAKLGRELTSVENKQATESVRYVRRIALNEIKKTEPDFEWPVNPNSTAKGGNAAKPLPSTVSATVKNDETGTTATIDVAITTADVVSLVTKLAEHDGIALINALVNLKTQSYKSSIKGLDNPILEQWFNDLTTRGEVELSGLQMRALTSKAA